ncbi:MAG: hypothetical protein ACTHNH_21105 [Mesorhizobium sp.]
MARLLHWPSGLKTILREPLSGPKVVGGGSTNSIGNFTQTFGSPFGLWRFRFNFPPMRGQQARRYRGWITALHGGANATRATFCDWDGLSKEQRGISGDLKQPWSNGMPWSNGQPWRDYAPVVSVSVAAALDNDTVTLADTAWGHGLGYGDQIGFSPFHFGLYMVTEVIELGTYRIWPPLRKALTIDDFATLKPVLAMRLESEEGATAARDASFISNATMTMVEVLDYDVRDYWTD